MIGKEVFMQPFGTFVLFYIIYLLSQKECASKKNLDLIVFSLSVSLYVQVGQLYQDESFDISCAFFLEIILFLWSIYIIANGRRVSRKNFYAIVFLVIVLIFNLIIMNIYPYREPMITTGTSPDAIVLGQATMKTVVFSFSNIFMALKIIMMAVIVLVVRQLSTEEIRYILNKIAQLGKLYLCYCVLEFIIKNVFRSNVLFTLQNIILGVANATYTGFGTRGGLHTLQGFTREPSNLALQLLIILCLLIYQSKILHKNNIVWIGMGLILLLGTRALTSVLCFFSVTVMLYLSKKDRLNKTSIIVLVILFCLALPLFIVILSGSTLTNNYFVSRFLNALIELSRILDGSWTRFGAGNVSNRARMYSLVEGIKVILNRPLMGTGVGTSGCLSEFVGFIGNLGFVGVTAWFTAVPFGKRIKNKKYKWSIFICLFPYFFACGESIFWTLTAVTQYVMLGDWFGDCA